MEPPKCKRMSLSSHVCNFQHLKVWVGRVVYRVSLDHVIFDLCERLIWNKGRKTNIYPRKVDNRLWMFLQDEDASNKKNPSSESEDKQNKVEVALRSRAWWRGSQT